MAILREKNKCVFCFCSVGGKHGRELIGFFTVPFIDLGTLTNKTMRRNSCFKSINETS